jgi:hypothetical protein
MAVPLSFFFCLRSHKFSVEQFVSPFTLGVPRSAILGAPLRLCVILFPHL